MRHGLDPTDGPRALHEQSRQELSERQRAAAECCQRGAGESAVACFRLLPADLDGDQPRGCDGGRFDAPRYPEDQSLLPECRTEVTVGENAVFAKAGEDHENSCAMPDAVSH